MSFPECINILHIFACKQARKLVKKAFDNKCKFIRTIDGVSSLSLALDFNNKELIEIIVDELVKLSEFDPKIISRIENELPGINYSSPLSLSKIYEHSFKKVDQLGLEKYGILKNESGILISSASSLIEESNFLDKANDESDKVNLIYRVSSFRMNFSPGNLEGIKFLESIYNCNDRDTLHTQVIKAIVLYKWDQVKYHIYWHNFVYLLFALSTIYYASLKGSYSNFGQFTVLLLNTIQFVYECLQMSVGTKNYLTSLWNLLDLLRIISAYIFIIFMFIPLDQDNIAKTIVILFLIISTLLKGLSFFECLPATRSMIKIFFEIIKDSIYFLILLIFSILAFTFLFMASSNMSFNESFSMTYSLSFGGFNIDNYSIYELICFHLATLIIPLLMFNLLVSIMNETFSRLKEDLIAEDIKALAELITDFESVLFWRKNLGEKRFLQSCSPEIEEKSMTDKRMKKIEFLAKEINSIHSKIRQLNNFSAEKNEEIDKKMCIIRDIEINSHKKINMSEGDFQRRFA